MIYEKCGEDGTEVYSKFHDRSLLMLVKDSIVGTFDPGAVTDPPTAAPSETACPTTSLSVMIDAAALAAHNTPQDCWVVYYGTGKFILSVHFFLLKEAATHLHLPPYLACCAI
jgi:hypothetical protein